MFESVNKIMKNFICGRKRQRTKSISNKSLNKIIPNTNKNFHSGNINFNKNNNKYEDNEDEFNISCFDSTNLTCTNEIENTHDNNLLSYDNISLSSSNINNIINKNFQNIQFINFDYIDNLPLLDDDIEVYKRINIYFKDKSDKVNYPLIPFKGFKRLIM